MRGPVKANLQHRNQTESNQGRGGKNWGWEWVSRRWRAVAEHGVREQEGGGPAVGRGDGW